MYNIISLEISGTDLAQKVRPPSIVSDIDWVENFWPFPGGPEAAKGAAARAADGLDDGGQPKGKAKNEWPKVQLYCLVSAAEDLEQEADASDGNEGRMDRKLPRVHFQLTCRTGTSTLLRAPSTTTCTPDPRCSSSSDLPRLISRLMRAGVGHMSSNSRPGFPICATRYGRSRWSRETPCEP